MEPSEANQTDQSPLQPSEAAPAENAANPAAWPAPVAGPAPAAQKWSASAITGFVLALAFFIPFVHLLAIVFSAIGLAATSQGKMRGRALAWWGLGIASANLIIGAILGAMGAMNA